MASPEEAQMVIRGQDGQMLDTKPVTVVLSRRTGPRKPTPGKYLGNRYQDRRLPPPPTGYYDYPPPPPRGYERTPYDRPYEDPHAAYPPAGYDRAAGGYDRGGYDRGGYDRTGYDRTAGYDRGGYDRSAGGGGGGGGYRNYPAPPGSGRGYGREYDRGYYADPRAGYEAQAPAPYAGGAAGYPTDLGVASAPQQATSGAAYSSGGGSYRYQ